MRNDGNPSELAIPDELPEQLIRLNALLWLSSALGVLIPLGGVFVAMDGPNGTEGASFIAIVLCATSSISVPVGWSIGRRVVAGVHSCGLGYVSSAIASATAGVLLVIIAGLVMLLLTTASS